MLHANTPSNRLDQRGFTLVEVLISMVVLAVVLSAITTLNFSAITSYTSSRDATEATFLGQKTLTAIVAESEQWKKNQATPSANLRGIYREDTGFIKDSLLKTILSQGDLQWVNLNAGGRAITSTGLPPNGTNATARFCVAGRHINFPAGTQLKGARIQIAVYYPGPSQPSVESCRELLEGNNVNSLTAVAASSGGGGGGPIAAPGEVLLSEKGTRTQFFSIIVTPPAPR